MTSTPVRLLQQASVLPVADIDRGIELYRRLGFSVARYSGAAPYAFAERDGVRLHLSQADHLDPMTSTVSLYLYVDDALALHREWRDAAVAGRLVEPRATEYGLVEGGYVDPDGNLIRFGSPLDPADGRSPGR